MEETVPNIPISMVRRNNRIKKMHVYTGLLPQSNEMASFLEGRQSR